MMLSGKARLAAVIGWPVSHSLSPRLHGYWLQRYRIDGAYVPLAVAPEDLVAVLRDLPRMGFVGANVTLPHKESALAAVGEVEALAQRVGAVNTIVVTEERGLVGRNTDVYGFLENLKAGAPGWRADQGPAVVIGAGGAARAVAVALAEAGAPEVRIANRTAARAQELAAALGAAALPVPWQERAGALDGAALVVNATVLGMTGAPPLDLDLGLLPREALVTDIVYSPLETPLLAAAAARGNAVVDGLGMLLHQARPGFAAWFGVEPEVTPELRAFVMAAAGGAR
ncbi:MAG: shikimate dehydrogenase [Alphaproteobacteria bacterium]